MGTRDTLPYGTWSSPISAAAVVAGERSLEDVVVLGDTVWWSQGDPTDGGRISLWCKDSAGTRQVTPDHYVRTGVHEYGGGAWAVAAGTDAVPVVVFSSWPDHRLWVVRGGDVEPLLPESLPHRYADLRVHPERDLVLAVREDHRGDDAGAEPVNELVQLSLSDVASNADGGTVIASGADFYASPELSSSGLLAWIEWDHPAMPWDRTRLMLGHLAERHPDGRAESSCRPESLLDDRDVSVLHPLWHSDPDGSDRLVVSSDAGGWWQLWSIDPHDPSGRFRLWDGEHDVCSPMWTLGAKPYAVTVDGVLAAWFVDGQRQLGMVPWTGGSPVLLEKFDAVGAISADDDRVALVLGHADGPSEVVVGGLGVLGRPDGFVPVARSSDTRPDPTWTSVPESVWWDGLDGPVQAWWYPPTNPVTAAPEGELPPLIIKSHGGPTSMARPLWSAAVQYWTSRGYGLLDVNYGGSSGFGRAYRNRLVGRWGIVDVADCIGGATSLADRGLADPARLVITGGSAGGYTTLAALTSSEVFAAGVSLYGIGDLATLARDTHKFESRYLDGLVGPWPEAEAVYVERSPIHHVDRLSSPMLVLQGTEDRVVPPAQAEQIVAAVRAKGLPVALVMYEGEGHGFRRAESIINHLESMQSFLGRVLGFTPADDLPELAIENLPDA